MGRIEHKGSTRRDAADHTRAKVAGHLSHINAAEDRLLEEMLPGSHGAVITSGLLAAAGRGRDDRLTKINAAERRLLKARGGSGVVNPRTGLLEYNNSGDSDDGSDSNTSNAGENTGGMSGAPGSGVAGPEGPGTGRGDGPGESGNYSTGYGNYGYDAYTGGLVGGRAYNPTTMPSVEDMLNTPNGYRAKGYEDLSMNQYSPPDTWGRLLDTFTLGPPRSYTQLGAVPGRYGGPTGRGPGVMGTMAGFLTGNPMSAMMGLGMHMDQAMSPESRAASVAANQATGAQNSGGREHWFDDPWAKEGLERHRAMQGSTPAGSDSGANTAQAGTPRPGGDQTNTPNLGTPEQVAMLGGGDSGAHTKTGLPQPVENLLADYIWRGRSGRGWGW